MAEQYSIAWIYQILLAHPAIGPTSGVVNNAKVDIVAVTLQTLPLVLLCRDAEAQGLEHVAISFLII